MDIAKFVQFVKNSSALQPCLKGRNNVAHVIACVLSSTYTFLRINWPSTSLYLMQTNFWRKIILSEASVILFTGEGDLPREGGLHLVGWGGICLQGVASVYSGVCIQGVSAYSGYASRGVGQTHITIHWFRNKLWTLPITEAWLWKLWQARID